MSERKRHPVRNTAAGVGVVAILAMLLGGRFGLGGGGTGGEGILPAQSGAEPVSATAAATQAPAAADDGVLTVTVREDALLYEGESVTLAELEAALLSDYKDGVGVELVDDHAIKGSFDEAAALLQRLAIEYTER